MVRLIYWFGFALYIAGGLIEILNRVKKKERYSLPLFLVAVMFLILGAGICMWEATE